MKKIINSLAVAVLTLPFFAAAQGTPSLPSGIPTTGLDSVTEATGLFNTYVGYAINLFWVLTVLFGIFAAFKYLTAKGDPKAAESAKQMVIYTVIAACVALLATVIQTIAGSVLCAN